jgi:DNA-binding response OmpR family regulator
MQILIAEDDDTSRAVLRRTLEKLGYGVIATRDGENAIAQFERERPGVVITDWMMPRLDGLEVCRRIRSETCHDRYVYLVVLTALGGKKNYLEAMDAGADDFLTKPFDPDELVARLRVAERIISLEHRMTQLEQMSGCCPDCRRVRRDRGWVSLRELAEEQGWRQPPRCPDCQRRQANERARATVARANA